ncbi:hypothetical protein VH571_07570 [Frondihabitans sp. 4ASC-45]|uniref:hypothetical protein n=1 Tax=Frondihabitans sp. 4ASC-45 TaxID=3111636 RepID=UPI003C1B65B6
MKRRIRLPAGRAALVAALVAAMIAGTSSTAFALWSTSRITQSSATIGSLVGGLSGTDAMTTTFSSTATSFTAPLTLTNNGTIAGTYSTSTVAAQSRTLAQNITVVAWQVAAAADCTASADAPSSSLSGTWASMPSLTGSLPAKQSAVWCLRSAPTSSAPASSTTNPVISMVLASGSWRSPTVAGGFYVDTAKAAAAVATATCTDQSGGNNVVIAWDASSRSPDTFYDLEIGGTRVGDPTQGYSASTTLSASRISTTVAPDGTARVDVVVLDANGNATATIQASSTVTLATTSAGRTLRCGA